MFYVFSHQFLNALSYIARASSRPNGLNEWSKGLIDTVTHVSLYSCLYATHQRDCAVLFLVVKEERPVRKPTDKVIALVLLNNPILSHTGIIPKARLLYQFYSINKLKILSRLGSWQVLQLGSFTDRR